MNMSFQLTLVIYDISETNLRNHIIKILQHYGLTRIQKSVFISTIDTKDKKYMIKELEKEKISDKDSIIIATFCKKCENNIIIIGDKELPKDEEFLII